MKVTAIIPARYASTRLPAKPLHLIAGKTLIQRVYEAVCETNLFDRVIIATDHDDIFKHCTLIGADVRMTAIDHKSGTDRIAECASNLDTDLIVNVQGDEPFICREPLQKLINTFGIGDALIATSTDYAMIKSPLVQVASLMHTIKNPDDIANQNCVKVVVDKNYDALYFSRSPIPFCRNYDLEIMNCEGGEPVFYKHIGVYAYRPEMLKTFVSLPQSNLEQIEKLEQLRLLENGYKIKMVLTDYTGIGIDTEEDVRKAEKIIGDRG